jgi:hypothetical protein
VHVQMCYGMDDEVSDCTLFTFARGSSLVLLTSTIAAPCYSSTYTSTRAPNFLPLPHFNTHRYRISSPHPHPTAFATTPICPRKTVPLRPLTLITSAYNPPSHDFNPLSLREAHLINFLSTYQTPTPTPADLAHVLDMCKEIEDEATVDYDVNDPDDRSYVRQQFRIT